MKKENCLISSWRGRKKLRKQSGIEKNQKDSLSLHKKYCAKSAGSRTEIPNPASGFFALLSTSFYIARIQDMCRPV